MMDFHSPRNNGGAFANRDEPYRKSSTRLILLRLVAAIAIVVPLFMPVNAALAAPWRAQGGSFIMIGGQQRQTYGSDLRMQTDGNLVLYDWLVNAPYPVAVWHTYTYGNPGAYANFQTDGNLVVYSSSGVALWDAQSWYNNPNATLTHTDDGNLQIFSSTNSYLRFSTNTSRTPASGSVPNEAPFNYWKANGTSHKWCTAESNQSYVSDWEYRFSGPGGEWNYEPTDLKFYQSCSNNDVMWYTVNASNMSDSNAYAETFCALVNGNTGRCDLFHLRISRASLTQSLPSHMKNNLVCHELGHTVGFNDGGTTGSSCMTSGQNARLGWWERNKINAFY